MPIAAIATERLTKAYGPRPIVRDLTFHVDPGEVYALVGPNGAGKTTVIRLVSGLAFPSSGSVRLLGFDPHQRPDVRRRLGAVVEAPAAFYPYLSGRANLELHARLVGGVPAARIGQVLDMMELGPSADRRVGVYSLGMRQRLGVAAALLSEPDVLILDEPASGMDPLSLHLVHRVLRDAAAQGTAVLLSTHHLDEVATYCSRVAILEEGTLIDEVDLRDRQARFRASVSDVHAARVLLDTQSFVTQAGIRGHEVLFQLTDPAELPRVAPVLTKARIDLLALSRDTFNLRAYYQDRLGERRASNADEAPDGEASESSFEGRVTEASEDEDAVGRGQA
ncbi:MAG: ABC transporter ATP-binding protein [Trueperaceae bacterium]